MPLSVTHALRWWARTTPAAPSIGVRDDVVTYRELDEWVDRVAQRLRDAGVREGDAFGIVGSNSLEWTIPYLAGMRIGALVTPFNHRLVAAELKPLIALCEPKIVFAANTHIERLREVQQTGERFDLWELEAVLPLRSGPLAPKIDLDNDPDVPSLLVFTSGTTGLPKAAVFTQRTIMYSATEWALMEPCMGPGIRFLLVISLALTGGVWSLSQTLVHGGEIYIESKLDLPAVLGLLESKRINVFFGPPIAFEQIAATPGFDTADLSQLASAMVGGAAVPIPVLKTWQAKGVALRQTYGLTEGGGAMLVMDAKGALEHPELVGHGGVFSHIRVVRDDGTDCHPGEIGEIIARRPAMTPGYYRNPEATAQLFRNGWLHTGDLGKLNEQGYLQIIDRMKDLVISGGFNITPSEIEAVIAVLPNVVEVVVIGAADAKFGEVPAALVRFEKDPLSPQDIVAHCNARLADFKVPRYVVVIDEPLPRNTAMKIIKPEVRRIYADIHEKYAKVR
jgi:fatty-acyl-CoA synthase